MHWIRTNLRRFQASNGKLNIRNIYTLPYKEYVYKNVSNVVLVLYMCTVEQLKTIKYYYVCIVIERKYFVAHILSLIIEYLRQK